MAKRREPKVHQAPADTATDELDVLHPERTVPVGGRGVTVREYGGIEWLRLQPAARPLVDAIAAVLESGAIPTYDRAFEVVGAHIDGLLPLIAQAADIEITDIEALSPPDLELLVMTWWGVNGRFFIGRATSRVAVAFAERRLAQSVGASSTPPSSLTATASTASNATPNGS